MDRCARVDRAVLCKAVRRAADRQKNNGRDRLPGDARKDRKIKIKRIEKSVRSRLA